MGAFADQNNGVITALATIAIAVFTLALVLVSNRQARLTKEAFVGDKRAFVFPIDLKYDRSKDTGSDTYSWRFRPVWRNSGATPTMGLRIHTSCELLNSELPNSFRFDQAITNIGFGVVLPPMQEMLGGIAPASPRSPISTQDLIDVQAGKKFLYIWGWATYRDIFQGTAEHLTRFCWTVTCTGNPRSYNPGIVLITSSTELDEQFGFTYAQHTIGNCVDDECPQ